MDDRLISLNAAIELVCKEGTRLERNGTVAMVEIKQWCVDLLETVPSVNAVQVVRCKDCKYHHYQGKHPYCNRQIDYSFGWADDDFCSRGERKDGKVNGNETD